jgi:carboxymethylenebutenolidase
MCYDDQARPPMPPGQSGEAHGQDIVLTAADGNRFAAYVAVPAQVSANRVIIYPDVRGLHQFYKELALRFAEIGISAIAIDYFGRTAGLTARDDTFEYMPHVQQLAIEAFLLDVKAAKEYQADNFGPSQNTFVVGFCMGGSLTLMTGTSPELGAAGLIPFYSGLSRAFGGKGTALEIASKVRYPVLGLFGGADQGIPVEQVHQLEEKLKEAGVPEKIIIYPGAPHSFFDRRATEFAGASSDAWQRVINFISTGSPLEV